jgi:hypothetical protein
LWCWMRIMQAVWWTLQYTGWHNAL